MLYLKKYEPKLLMVVNESQWREPSLAQPKDMFGNAGFRVSFRVTGYDRTNTERWTGRFKNRDDMDAFAYALACYRFNRTPIPRQIWSYPTPEWNPDFERLAYFEMATDTFISSPTGSNQTYTSPSDWNNSNNNIYVIGGGGGGAAIFSGTAAHACGGGGGGYSTVANFTFAAPGSTTATYQIGANAPGWTLPTANTTAGGGGKASWFNGTALVGSTVGAAGGSGGANGTGSQTGGAGGAAASGTGTTKNSGGAGGNLSGASGSGGSGGGGAGGPSGNGNAGTNSASTGALVTTAGGSANAGAGNPWTGGNPGGGGGGAAGAGAVNGGGGSSYGGGGGGAFGNAANVNSGIGASGLIYITYLGLSNAFFIFF